LVAEFGPYENVCMKCAVRLAGENAKQRHVGWHLHLTAKAREWETRLEILEAALARLGK
jgi:hypothetical protein